VPIRSLYCPDLLATGPHRIASKILCPYLAKTGVISRRPPETSRANEPPGKPMPINLPGDSLNSTRSAELLPQKVNTFVASDPKRASLVVSLGMSIVETSPVGRLVPSSLLSDERAIAQETARGKNELMTEAYLDCRYTMKETGQFLALQYAPISRALRSCEDQMS